MNSLLEILGAIWAVIVAFIRGPNETPVLPVTVDRRQRRPSVRSRRQEEDEDYSLEVWQLQKEEFMRHPSLRTAKKNRHANGTSRSRSKSSKKQHKRHRSHRGAHLPVSVHDWNTIIASAHTPPPVRPPRPWPDSVPAVIITPCTPTAGDELLIVKPDLIYTTPSVSPLDLTIAAIQNGNYSSSSSYQVQRRATVSHTHKPGSDPPYKSKISEVPAAYRHDYFDSRKSPVANLEHSEKSFYLSQSMDGIFKSASENSSVASQHIRPWKDMSTFPHPEYISASRSYTTSTPPRKSLGSALGTPKWVSNILPSSRTMPHPLYIPSEQMDLLPYPEVFDLDAYYGTSSERGSSSSTSTAEPSSSSSSDIRYPLKEKNPFSSTVDTPKFLNSPPCPTSSPSDSSGSPAPTRRSRTPHTPTAGGIQDEIARLRAHYRQHHTFADSPGSTSASGESGAFSTPTPNPRSARLSRVPVLRPRPSLPLLNTKSSRGARASTTEKGKGRPALARASTVAGTGQSAPPTPVSAPVSAFNFASSSPIRPLARSASVHTNRPPPPIVVVSHHRFGSLSQDDSQPEPASDVSREVLQARLRETCEHFSRSISEDESTSTSTLSTSGDDDDGYTPRRF